MKVRTLLVALLLLAPAVACSNPAEPTPAAVSESPLAPSFATTRTMRPGTYVAPNGMTCAQIFLLAYGPYNGANSYWMNYYNTVCYVYTTTVSPTPTSPTPTYPAPTPTPTCSYSRTGCTKTATNN